MITPKTHPWVIAYWATIYPLCAKFLKVKRHAGAYRKVHRIRKTVLNRAVRLGKRYNLSLKSYVKRRWGKCRPCILTGHASNKKRFCCGFIEACPWCYAREVASVTKRLLSVNLENCFYFLLHKKEVFFDLTDRTDINLVNDIRRNLFRYRKFLKTTFRSLSNFSEGCIWFSFPYLELLTLQMSTFAVFVCKDPSYLEQFCSNFNSLHLVKTDKKNLAKELIKTLKINMMHSFFGASLRFYKLFSLPRLKEMTGCFRSTKRKV